MTTAAPLALDLVAISLLTFALYLPRHRRRDLVVALLGVNVGVLAVSVALSSGTIGAGLGLGLFGVLSIIRLRSTELGQHEVAYYFSALALGLVGGLAATPLWLTASLMALVLVALWVGDHPRLLTRHRSRLVNLDVAIIDDTALVAELERRLGARVHAAHVVKVDLVLETTLVEVRYEVPRPGAAPAATGRRETPGVDAVTATAPLTATVAATDRPDARSGVTERSAAAHDAAGALR